MATTVSKIEFPRNSPEGLLTMVKTLLKTYDKDPSKVNLPTAVIDRMRRFLVEAENLRTQAKEMAARAVQLNGSADIMLGTATGQSLSNSETLAGSVADFRDYASLSFKDNIEQLKEYGFSVKITQKAARISQERTNKIRAQKP